MKILLVIEPSGGGSGRHVVDLADALSRNGHQVCVVYAPNRAEARFEAEIAALPLYALERVAMNRSIGSTDLESARALQAVIDRLGPFDVIHGHSAKAGGLTRIINRRGATMVYTPHALRTMDPTLGLPGRLVYGSIETLLAWTRTDALIAVAPEEAEHARHLGIPKSKIHTVVNGLRPAPSVDREAVRQRFGLEPHHVAVGFVGRLADQKDPVRFARAIRLAAAADPRMRGVVLGDGDLIDAVREEGGEALTVVSGLDARSCLPAFDLFAMTSRYEAMPYVLLEALQAGLPIVSTAVGGTSVTVDPQRNGALLPVDATPEIVAEALHAAATAERRAAMAAASFEMGQRYDLAGMALATERVYRSHLHPRGSSLHKPAKATPSS